MSILVSDVIALARKFAHTDSVGLPDANGIDFLNAAMLEQQKMLIVERESLFIQEAYRDLTAEILDNGSSPGKVLFPSDLWFLKQIEINIQDTSNQNLYFPATPADSSNLQPGNSLDALRANQPVNKPLILNNGDWFEVLPTPKSAVITDLTKVTKAFRIQYFKAPVVFVATTDALVYPFTLDFRPLARKVAAIYLEPLNRDESDVQDAKFKSGTDELVGMLDTGSELQTTAQDIGLTGYEF